MTTLCHLASFAPSRIYRRGLFIVIIIVGCLLLPYCQFHEKVCNVTGFVHVSIFHFVKITILLHSQCSLFTTHVTYIVKSVPFTLSFNLGLFIINQGFEFDLNLELLLDIKWKGLFYFLVNSATVRERAQIIRETLLQIRQPQTECHQPG